MMPKTCFSTALSGSARETERRIRNIFQGPKKRPPVWLMALAALTVLSCGGLAACRAPDAGGEPGTSQLLEASHSAPSPTAGDYSFSVRVSGGRTLTAVLLAQNPEEDYLSIEQIQIYDGDELLQTIELSSIPPVEDYAWDGLFVNQGYAVGEPDIRDMNFDGAEDFGLLAVDGYPQNVPYSYFLWNEEENRFDYAFTLFNSDGLEADAEHRQLIEQSHDGMGQYVNYYEYAADGSLRLINSTEPDLPAPADDTPDAPAGQNARTAAYAAVLEDLYYNNIYPDGSQYDSFGSDPTSTDFAIYDVDGDGRVELVLRCYDTYTAGHQGLIYDFDESSGKVRKQFSEYPLFTFYDNGAIQAGLSHNQGWAGDFWPYSLYVYEPSTDSYQLVGMVDAWDKALSDGNPGVLPPFPSELDTSGTGFLYYIYEKSDRSEQSAGQPDPVDASVYNEWLDAYLGGAFQVELPYQDLTEENIRLLKADA